MVYKLIVALAVVALTSSHELTMNGGRCLCLRTTDKMVFAPTQLKTIEILPPSASCENVEIIKPEKWQTNMLGSQCKPDKKYFPAAHQEEGKEKR
ncbi:unnamed protein product [Natator depressus]